MVRAAIVVVLATLVCIFPGSVNASTIEEAIEAVEEIENFLGGVGNEVCLPGDALCAFAGAFVWWDSAGHYDFGMTGGGSGASPGTARGVAPFLDTFCQWPNQWSLTSCTDTDWDTASGSFPRYRVDATVTACTAVVLCVEAHAAAVAHRPI